MNVKFQYLLDPTFLVSTVVYIINKHTNLLSIFVGEDFSNNYLNDILLVPVVVPLVAFLSKLVDSNKSDLPPSMVDISILLVIWAIIFEFIGPHFFKAGTSDPLDVAAYCLGGFISWLIWNRPVWAQTNTGRWL